MKNENFEFSVKEAFYEVILKRIRGKGMTDFNTLYKGYKELTIYTNIETLLEVRREQPYYLYTNIFKQGKFYSKNHLKSLITYLEDKLEQYDNVINSTSIDLLHEPISRVPRYFTIKEKETLPVFEMYQDFKLQELKYINDKYLTILEFADTKIDEYREKLSLVEEKYNLEETDAIALYGYYEYDLQRVKDLFFSLDGFKLNEALSYVVKQLNKSTEIRAYLHVVLKLCNFYKYIGDNIHNYWYQYLTEIFKTTQPRRV